MLLLDALQDNDWLWLRHVLAVIKWFMSIDKDLLISKSTELWYLAILSLGGIKEEMKTHSSNNSNKNNKSEWQQQQQQQQKQQQMYLFTFVHCITTHCLPHYFDWIIWKTVSVITSFQNLLLKDSMYLLRLTNF